MRIKIPKGMWNARGMWARSKKQKLNMLQIKQNRLLIFVRNIGLSQKCARGLKHDPAWVLSGHAAARTNT